LHLAGRAIEASRSVSLSRRFFSPQQLPSGWRLSVCRSCDSDHSDIPALRRQIGPGLVLIPAVIWIYSTRGAVWGTGFLVWAIFCSTFDNFLRPMLIKKGADLPCC